MNKWIFLTLMMLMICVSGILFFSKTDNVPTFSYFPLDEQSHFIKTDSDLRLDSSKITWTSDSKSDKNMYLRQDASLLFDNGKLRGVRSKWEQNKEKIGIKETLSFKGSSLFQVISFHHGEIHTSNDQIKSIQDMSDASLYVVDSPSHSVLAFESPVNDSDTAWKNLIDKTVKQELLVSWHQLFKHFDIPIESYLAVPLTNLYKYNKEPLPSMSQEETNQVIGQLWEGLYKNYIIPATKTKNNQGNNYIPIILFDKNHKQLLVLFELNGKKQKLIQKYPHNE